MVTKSIYVLEFTILDIPGALTKKKVQIMRFLGHKILLEPELFIDLICYIYNILYPKWAVTFVQKDSLFHSFILHNYCIES